MNYYPGEGLGVGTAILGSTVGQAYPAGSILPLCKIWGMLVNLKATPTGTASTAPATVGGRLVFVPTWDGVTVTASINSADILNGKIVTVDKVTAVSNEQGYFEIYVLQGLSVTVSCPVFGRTIMVDTMDLASIDLSTFF